MSRLARGRLGFPGPTQGPNAPGKAPNHPQAELFVRQRERPGLHSQAVAWPPRLSAGRRDTEVDLSFTTLSQLSEVAHLTSHILGPAFRSLLVSLGRTHAWLASAPLWRSLWT